MLAVPIVIWSVTGSYFVLMDLNFIHSDHISVEKSAYIDPSQISYPLSKVNQRYPNAQEIELKSVVNNFYYHVSLKDKVILINASSGESLPYISEDKARSIASQYQQAIAADASLTATLLTDIAPAELAARHLPVWRMDFSDNAATSLYLSATTGELVTRRHDYWRLFDLFWKWHIMDYDDGESVDNLLLLISSILSIMAVVAGLILIWQRRRRYL